MLAPASGSFIVKIDCKSPHAGVRVPTPESAISIATLKSATPDLFVVHRRFSAPD